MESVNVKNINEMIKENEGLIHYTLKRYFYTTTSEFDIYEDMVQVGRIALYKAIETYDETRTEFSTYAVKVIKSKLINFVQNDLYKNFSKGGLNKVHDTEGIDDDKMRERTVGRFDDHSNVETNELLDYIKNFKDERAYKIVCLLSEGYTYEEIGDMLDLSKQRVNQIITKLRKHLIDNKEVLGLSKYDYEDDSTIIDNKPVEVFDDDRKYYNVFPNYLEACKELNVDKYTVKRNLLNRKYTAWVTCIKLNGIKLHFRLK